MRIAICDDERDVIDIFVGLVEKYALQNQYVFYMDVFTSANNLISSLGVEMHDLYILDINMPDIDGISLAKKIRNYHPQANIAFATGYGEYIADVVNDIHVFAYLIKPVSFEKVSKLLGDFMNINVHDAYISLISGVGTDVEISLRHVMYIESRMNTSVFITINDEYYLRKTLNELCAILPSSFVRCHKGYIVNLLHATKTRTKYCQISNGKTLSVGRTYADSFMVACIEYTKARSAI